MLQCIKDVSVGLLAFDSEIIAKTTYNLMLTQIKSASYLDYYYAKYDWNHDK